MSTKKASDVEMIAIDLSQVLVNNTVTIGAFVFRSRRGRITPYLSSRDNAIVEYGNPDYNNYGVSFGAALVATRTAGSCQWRRVVGSGYAYAGVVLAYESSESKTYLLPVTSGQQPADFDFAAFKATWEAANSGKTLFPLELFYPVGPGVYANTELKLGITSSNIAAITAVTPTLVTGGSLVAASYSYKVTALNANGETTATIGAATIASLDVTNGLKSVKLEWPAVVGATGYIVYGRTGGAYNRIAELGSTSLSFVDNGSVTPDTAYTPNTKPYVSSDVFGISVFDMLRSKTSAQETFECTLREAINGFNEDSQVTVQVNGVSQYIASVSNVNAVYPLPNTLPVLHTATPELFAGGADGSAPTLTDVALAWNDFRNRDKVRINMLVDTGWANPTVAAAMRTIADIQRGHFLNDVPNTRQNVIGATNYRNNDLAQDTRRGSIYTPWMLGVDDVIGGTRTFPPACFAAQRLFFTDDQFSAGRSPAGLNRGVTDALDVALKVNNEPYYWEDSDRDTLVGSQINYFRNKNGVFVLWEQRTLQRQFSAASFISVSRIWDIIQNSIEEFLEYDLQEPNDDFFALQIKTALEAYLQQQVIQRNLSDFAVYVDERAGNTPQVLSQGQRNVDVYLSPELPANRIRCRTILTRQGVKFQDIVLA